MFYTLLIGGGVAGLSCALFLGSAKNKVFSKTKHIAIITHQKTSHLQTALFNNALGLVPETTGASILESGKKQLTSLYLHIEQIENEKVLEILKIDNYFHIKQIRTIILLNSL